MSVWEALRNSNRVQNIEDVFARHDVTSPDMKRAITDWILAYYRDSRDDECNPCDRLPVAIVSKLYKTIFSEYTATAQGGQKAFFQDILNRLHDVQRRAVQMQLIGGECLIKPVPNGSAFDFVLIRRDRFVPFARDELGRLTSVGTAEQTVTDGRLYTLLECRTAHQNGELQIESRLFCRKIGETGTLGNEVQLSTLPKYADLRPQIVIPGVGGIGMAQLRTPNENTIDGSPDAVAVYAAAMGLIREESRNQRMMELEFENGASRIIASADMLSHTPDGKQALTDTLFVGLDDDPSAVGVTVFSPALREASYLARKQDILRSVETLIGLKRGILSEVEATERTATEITSSAGDYNLTILDFQSEWTKSVRELMQICAALGSWYGFLPSGAFNPEDIVLDYGDGVLYNRDKTWQEMRDMVAAGLLKPELALAWYYELPHDTQEQLAQIRETYMPEG